jgi:prefoldin alpha subunit
MSEDDQNVYRRLVVELQMLEGTADTLQSRLNFVNANATELTYAQMTLEGIEKENTDASLIVPIGGSSYIKAKLESADKVIVGIGAGVSKEHTITEAKQTIQNRISELEKAKTSVQQQLVQVLNRIQEDRDRLQELATKLSQTERTNGVQKTAREP